jgi:hypothetical protein
MKTTRIVLAATAAVILSAVFSLSGCGDLLSSPPSTVTVTLAADPAAVTTYSGAAISWTTNVDCLYAIEYGTAAGTYSNATPKSATAASQHSATLSALSPSTQYFYRIVSFYEGIRPFNSAEFAFTTAAAPAGPAAGLNVVATPVSAPTYYNATVDFTTSVPATYALEYGTAAATYTAATVRTGVAATAHSATLASLAPSTTYYYRIGLYYEGAFARYSPEYSFTTAADPVSAMSIAGTPASAPTHSGATITFGTSRAGTYALEYGTVSTIYASATPKTSVPDTFHTAVIGGLSPGTRYYYRMVLYLGGNFVANSAEYHFDTAADPNVLSINSGPTVTPTLTTLDIDWGSNLACTHVLEYDIDSGAPYAYSRASAVPDTMHSETITGLASGTTYYYRIRLLWNSGADLVSAEYSAATTAETVPTAAQKARGIWIIGGLSGSGIGTTVGTIDLYDPLTGPTGTWYPAAASTTGYVPVSFAAYAAYGGKLYVIGGFSDAGAVQSLVQIYTIATNAWTTGTPLPVAKANINASILNGKIYILGGTTANAGNPWAAAATTYEYSIAGDTWISTKVAYGAAGSERFSYGYDGTVYNLGGRTSATAVALTHDGLLPSTVAQPVNGELTGTGVVELAMTAARSGFSGGVYKPSATPAFIYLIGGASVFTATTGCFVNQGTTGGTVLNMVQYLHYPFTAPRAWTTAGANPSYPTSIAFGASVVSTAFSPARIYHFGGTQALGGSAAGQASGYWIPTPPDPQSTWNDTWTAISGTGMNARWGQGAVTLNQ